VKQELYGLQVDYHNEHGHFMILSAREGLKEEELSPLQIKMLTLQRIPRLLPMHLQARDGNVQLYYEITGRRMLAQWLRQETISLMQFYDMLHSIAEVLDDSKIYMLQPGRYILREDYLFCGEGPTDLYFTYVPKDQLDSKGSIPSDLQHLASRLVHRVRELQGGGFQELMSYLLEESFTITEWKRLLQKHMSLLETSRLPASEVAASQEAPEITMPEYHADTGWTPEHPATSLDTTHDHVMELPSIEVTTALWKKQLLLAVMLALSCVLLWQLYADRPEEGMLYLCAGGTLLLADAAWVAYCLLTSGTMKAQTQPVTESYMGGGDHFFREIGLPYEPVAMGSLSTNPISVPTSEPSAPAHTVLLATPEATMLLTPESQAKDYQDCPRLIFVKQGIQEAIPLRKNHFVIGRAGVEVDWVHEDAGVSRIHAEFCQDQGIYSVKDLGSRNGTLLNGVALVPYRMYPLNDGDTIKIIRTDFTFKMGS
jgi:hypothetical protein